MNEKGNGGARHTLSLLTREKAEITGVVEVESFDEETVVLKTDCGEMTVEGRGLHVATLDIERGVVVLDGRVNAVYYTDVAPKRQGLRAKLFG